jgi:large subunit ribosomal protein L22
MAEDSKVARGHKEAKALARFIRVPPRKARAVVDLVRGRRVGEAITLLKFTPRSAARLVEKVLKSAIANAEQQELGDVDELWVARAYVNQGPTMKRIQPAPMGRAHPIKKRTSHITVVVSARTTDKRQS